MPSFRRALALVTVLVSLQGCYARTGYHGAHVHSHHHHGGGGLALVAVAGVIAGAAVVASADAERERELARRETVYVQPVVYVNPPPAMPASARDRVPAAPTRPAFDAKAARAALAGVDLAACRDEGAPRGYGHAKITFNPDGRASKVVVDTPDGLSAGAVKCIGDRLGAVSVAEYEGNLVTVGTTWFVP